MTLPVTDRIAGPYSCNGVVDDFDFAFKVFTTADIRVVKTSSAGVEAVLVLDSDYTVVLNADQENDPGGTVTTSTAFATGFTITIDGALTYGQTAELTNLGTFFPKVIERALDRLGILIQQLKKLTDRAIKYPVADGNVADLPIRTVRASKYLSFDASGDPVASAGTGADAGLRTDLAADGAPLVGYLDTGTDASVVSLHAILRGRVYAQSYGFSAAASAAVNALAIMRAHNMTGTRGGRIILPRNDGAFAVAADTIKFTQRNITLEGDSNAMGYETSFGGTLLQFAAGNYGIDLTTWDGGSAGGYAAIENIAFDGNDVLQRAIWAGGEFILRGCAVMRCTVVNIDLFNGINTARLESFSSFDGAIGLLVGSASGGSNTAFSVENFAIRQNVTGVRIVNARGFSFANGVVESNTGAGLEIYQPTGGQVNHGYFREVWFEENRFSGGAGYQITIDAQTGGASDRPGEIDFINCTMEATAPTDAINVISGEYVRLIDCDFTAGADITFGADTYRCGYINHTGLRHIEGTLGNHASSVDNYIGTLTTSGPEVKALVQAGFTGQITGCTTNPTAACKYTKHGDQVTLEIPAIGPLTSDATTKTIVNFPASLIPTSGTRECVVSVIDNGGASVFGVGSLSSSGVFSYSTSAGSAGFTASGSFSARRVTMTYSLGQ